MSPLTISFNDKTAIVYQPSLVDSTIKPATNINIHYKLPVPTKKRKDLQVQFASALVHEVRKSINKYQPGN
jgi:hypothetical protein